MYCNDSDPFDPANLDPLRPLLGVFWPSMNANSGASFHGHEWAKHGTCTRLPASVIHDSARLARAPSPRGGRGGVSGGDKNRKSSSKYVAPTQLEFFSTVLSLRLKTDLAAVFASCGILPSFKPSVLVSDLGACIESKMGVSNTLVSCSQAVDGSLQLNEVWLSLDDHLNLINTPQDYHTVYAPTMGCAPTDLIALPPFTDPLLS